MFTQRTRSLGVLFLAFAAGCNSGPEEGPRRVVVVDGSSTAFRISRAAQELYASVNPDVLVVVNNHGTGGGFGRYLQGEVDVVDASRLAKPEEEAKAKAQGIDWTRFVVGYDGITVVVNPKNDFVKSLSAAQLKALWEPGSQVKTWKDLDPSWPDRTIVLYCPDHDSGTYEFFIEAIIGKDRGQRTDVQASADDNTLVSGVAGDAQAIGYFGYAYYASNADQLRAVPIQAGPDAEVVAPSPETILSKTYQPLSRPLFIYVKKSALRRPEVADFVKYYLDNVADLAKKAGYVAPTADDIAANQAVLTPPTTVPPARAVE
jgi:phosphate transport system substrate-binding protein